MQSLSEYKNLCIVNDMLTSFDFKNHENLGEQKGATFDSLL
jgi:hypothetical protein